MEAGTDSLQGQYTDSALITAETAALKAVLFQEHGHKKQLVVEAGHKLAQKYADDTSVVCARLQRCWAGLEITANYIQRCLPPEYKQQRHNPHGTGQPTTVTGEGGGGNRPDGGEGDDEALYPDDDDLGPSSPSASHNTPPTTHDDPAAQYWDATQDMLTAMSRAIRAMAAATARSPEEASAAHAAITTMNSHTPKQFLAEIREATASAQGMAALQDGRQKYSTAMKITLKTLYLFLAYEHVAGMLYGARPHGAKWMSKIDHDPEIHTLMERAGKCPSCGWDQAVWYEKAREAQRMMRKVPPIPPRGGKKEEVGTAG